MLSPDEVKADYRAMMNERGATVTLRRYTGSGDNRPFFDADVMAVDSGYQPHEVVELVKQGDRKLIILAEDLFDARWPAAPGSNRLITTDDEVYVRGDRWRVIAPDESTRRVRGVLIAIELQVRGV